MTVPGTPVFPARPYESASDLLQMHGLLAEARARCGDWRYPHIGDLMWTFFLISCHFDSRRHVRLWHDGDKLVGYALLGDDACFDWQTLPEYARKGIEVEALEWAENLALELRSRDAERWRGPITVGTRIDNAERIAFLEEHGFRRGEYVEVNMLRSLEDPIPAPVVPVGFRVREMAGDAKEMAGRAAVEREVWGQWSCGNISGDDYARLVRMPGYDQDLDLVAVAPDGGIAANVNGWLDSVNKIGDLGPVGAREAYRRQGLTRAILSECMRRMKARGMDRVCVSTGESNVAARNLYESVGFQTVNRYVEYAREPYLAAEGIGNANPVCYFEIPVADMDRAAAFYTAVFGLPLGRAEVDGNQMALFSLDPDKPGVGGALTCGDSYVPGRQGARLYFRTASIAESLRRAVAAGGRQLYPETAVAGVGRVAEFEDSEGNCIALFTPLPDVVASDVEPGPAAGGGG